MLDWHRRGFLRSPRQFSWTWNREGERVASISVQTERHSVTLKYRSRSGEDWSDVEQRIPIVWTPCRFGSERPWLVCAVASNGAHCGRRAIKMYVAGKLFACRQCYRLVYASQQETVSQRGRRKAPSNLQDNRAAGRASGFRRRPTTTKPGPAGPGLGLLTLTATAVALDIVRRPKATPVLAG
jgi:hypothetical protein